MKAVIKKVPIPLSGVMLGTAALGNLLQSYSEAIRYGCGIIAALLFLLLVLKLLLYPAAVKEDLKNPIMASVAATFPMGIMLLSVYAKPWLGIASKYIWYAAILLHIIIILYFTAAFMRKLQMPKVFASYFIVYVGIAVAGITAPAYEKEKIGITAFWFAFVCLILLLLLIGYRYLRHPQIPEPARPLACIFAAPTSLCLAAYIQSASEKSTLLIGFMAILASLLYLFALVILLPCLRLKFYPSYAAFTFPFVISAIALKQTMEYLANIGNPLPFLQYVVLFETILAVILVVYTLIRYLIFFCAKVS